MPMTKVRSSLNLPLLLFVFSFSFFSPCVASALPPGSELRVGYSNFPLLLYGDFGKDVFYWYNRPSLSYLPKLEYSRGDEIAVGQLVLDYTYRFTPGFELHGSLSWTPTFARVTDPADGRLVGHDYKAYYSFVPAVRFNWLRREDYKMYSGIGLGFSLFAEKMHYPGGQMRMYELVPAFSITWIGVSFGHTWYGFAELTSGTLGFGQIGVGYRF